MQAKRRLIRAAFYSMLMGLVYGFGNHLNYMVSGTYVGFWSIVFIYAKCMLMTLGTVFTLLAIAYFIGKMYR